MNKRQKKKNYTEEQLKAAHKKCRHNRESLEKSKKCGCFYCLNIFKPDKIKESSKEGDAICPCQIDSILASHDMKITKKLLKEMHKRYFMRFRVLYPSKEYEQKKIKAKARKKE